MLSAINVARQLIRIGWSPEDAVLVNSHRLQKLLYYSQGYYLALLGEPLFHEPIEAGANGPVVRAVAERFAGITHGITPDAAGDTDEPLSQTQKDFLEMIWREYGQYPPAELSAMTRREPAWAEARAGAGAESAAVALSLATMKAFFTQEMWEKARKQVPAGFPVPDPTDVWQAELEFEQSGGKGIPMDEAFERAKAACRVPTRAG